MDSTNRAGTFVRYGTTTAIATVGVVGVTETDAVPQLVGDDVGGDADPVTRDTVPYVDLPVRKATRREPGRAAAPAHHHRVDHRVAAGVVPAR